MQNLCKDWHDSGYCPFGNSCLYLHDRSNHKTGWELEKEYEKSEKERWKRISNPELALKEAQEASLKLIEKYKPAQECGLCKEPFEKPVEVECGHIFCMRCAIKLPKCQQCGKKLSGIMNNAEKFLSQQSEQYEEMKGKMQKESEMTLIRRQKYQNIDSLDVFADWVYCIG